MVHWIIEELYVNNQGPISRDKKVISRPFSRQTDRHCDSEICFTIIGKLHAKNQGSTSKDEKDISFFGNYGRPTYRRTNQTTEQKTVTRQGILSIMSTDT